VEESGERREKIKCHVMYGTKGATGGNCRYITFKNIELARAIMMKLGKARGTRK
jgi:hypothetical protein